MKFRSYVFSAMCGLISIAAAAQSTQVPNTFQPGTPAQAAQVNQNFQSVDSRINSSLGALIRTIYTSSDNSGVASFTCPANSLVMSAGCRCNDVTGTRNNGVLFACTVVGNSGLMGCFINSGTYNPNLPSPRADISVVCLSAKTNAGQVIPPSLASAPGDVVQKTSKDLSDELERELKITQDQVADFTTELSRRESK